MNYNKWGQARATHAGSEVTGMRAQELAWSEGKTRLQEWALVPLFFALHSSPAE